MIFIRMVNASLTFIRMVIASLIRCVGIALLTLYTLIGKYLFMPVSNFLFSVANAIWLPDEDEITL